MEAEGTAKVLLSVLWFVFIAFAFPTLQTAIANANTTIVFYDLLPAFPYLLLGVSLAFPFLVAYKEQD